jgi:uncharacterized protein (TIGR02271 family)
MPEQDKLPDQPQGAESYDSGEVETLADGSISVPIIEEEVVITKRRVVKERIIIRRGTIVESRRVDTTLRKERVVIEEEANSELEQEI